MSLYLLHAVTIIVSYFSFFTNSRLYIQNSGTTINMGTVDLRKSASQVTGGNHILYLKTEDMDPSFPIFQLSLTYNIAELEDPSNARSQR